MVRDVLVWDQITTIDQVNYQSIANNITLQWQSYRIPNTENYADELNATNLRGYMRDEVYAFEIVFLLKNGKQTDGFHIPGRTANANDLYPVFPTNNDFIGEPDPSTGSLPWWKIYNSATVTGFSPEYSNASEYKGNYQYGDFAYWESTDVYPCNELIWGELANQPIRHHKFPDVLVSPIYESAIFASPSQMAIQQDAVIPIGVKVDLSQITALIGFSNLTQEQKDNIEGFKIVRGDRSTNKSIVAKGILRNVGLYSREGADYYYPNYPYNDLTEDPFLLSQSNAYTANAKDGGSVVCRNFSIIVTALDGGDPFVVEYIDCYTNSLVTKESTTVGEVLNICCLDFPVPRIVKGTGTITPNTYSTYVITPNEGSFSADFYIYFPTRTQVGVTGVSGYNSLVPPEFVEGDTNYTITVTNTVGYDICNPGNLKGFDTDASKYRHVFNSPETSFGQPFYEALLL
jgi:hypothetical protein